MTINEMTSIMNQIHAFDLQAAWNVGTAYVGAVVLVILVALAGVRASR